MVRGTYVHGARRCDKRHDNRDDGGGAVKSTYQEDDRVLTGSASVAREADGTDHRRAARTVSANSPDNCLATLRVQLDRLVRRGLLALQGLRVQLDPLVRWRRWGLGDPAVLEVQLDLQYSTKPGSHCAGSPKAPRLTVNCHSYYPGRPESCCSEPPPLPLPAESSSALTPRPRDTETGIDGLSLKRSLCFLLVGRRTSGLIQRLRLDTREGLVIEINFPGVSLSGMLK